MKELGMQVKGVPLPHVEGGVGRGVSVFSAVKKTYGRKKSG
jgi:hypothetical protein